MNSVPSGKILITGGAGFIGSAVQAPGEKVSCLQLGARRLQLKTEN
jgi:hypothetical protein